MVEHTTSSTQRVAGTDSRRRSASSLETPTTNCADSHGDWFFVNRATGEVRPYRCRGWRCERCGSVKRGRWISQVGAWATAKGLTRFATLTFGVAYDRADARWDYVQGVWERFRRELGRVYGAVSFVRVVEFSPVDRLHIHCLFDRFIPQRWLSAVWSSCGGGRVVDIRYRDTQRVGSYLAKYLAKALQFAYPRGRRRWTSSRDIRLWETPGLTPKRREPSGWRLWMGGGNVTYAESDVSQWLGNLSP